MSEAKAEFAYYGFRPCGHCVAGCVDIPKFAADTAEFVADLIKRGLTVKRLPLGEHPPMFDCDCGKPSLPLFSPPHPLSEETEPG